MNRYLLVFGLVAALCISSLINIPVLVADDVVNNIQIDTPEEAAEFAAKLANEKCQKTFGRSPFTPDSYPARLTGAKWCWGKIELPGIGGGYSAEVEFNTDGSGQSVRTVLHTDRLERTPNNNITIFRDGTIDQTPLQLENLDDIVNEEP